MDINNEQLKNFADKLYRDLINKNINVLYDDTDNRVGVKFASNDLIGIPLQIIIGQKNMKNNFITNTSPKLIKTMKEKGAISYCDGFVYNPFNKNK